MWSSLNALEQQCAEQGEKERGAGIFEVGMFPSGLKIPVEFSEMRGQVVRPRWEDTGLLNAEFTLLFLGQKRFVCSVRVLASLKGTVLLEALSLSTVFQDP